MENAKAKEGTVWLTKKDAMRHISASKRALEYYMADGKVRYYQLGGKILFDRDELDQDIKGKRKQS